MEAKSRKYQGVLEMIIRNDNKAVESSAKGKLESAVSDVTEDKNLDLEEGEIE